MDTTDDSLWSDVPRRWHATLSEWVACQSVRTVKVERDIGPSHDARDLEIRPAKCLLHELPHGYAPNEQFRYRCVMICDTLAQRDWVSVIVVSATMSGGSRPVGLRLLTPFLAPQLGVAYQREYGKHPESHCPTFAVRETENWPKGGE
jgi:hypothetical protein